VRFPHGGASGETSTSALPPFFSGFRFLCTPGLSWKPASSCKSGPRVGGESSDPKERFGDASDESPEEKPSALPEDEFVETGGVKKRPPFLSSFNTTTVSFCDAAFSCISCLRRAYKERVDFGEVKALGDTGEAVEDETILSRAIPTFRLFGVVSVNMTSPPLSAPDISVLPRFFRMDFSHVEDTTASIDWHRKRPGDTP